MGSVLPIFKTAYYDIKRGRVYQVLLLFVFLMLASSNVFAFFTRGEEIKIIKDFGLMSINLFGILFILFGLSRHLPREIEDKTIYTILTNPVTRTHILIANLCAYLYALLIGFLIMTAIFYSILYLKEGGLDPLMAKGIILIYMKVLVFSTLVLFFSVVFSPLLTIAFSLFLYIAGHLTNYFSSLADQKNFLGWILLKGLYTILPNFENFNCSDSLVLGTDVSWRYIGLAGIYSLFYGTAIFLLTCILFKRREI